MHTYMSTYMHTHKRIHACIQSDESKDLRFLLRLMFVDLNSIVWRLVIISQSLRHEPQQDEVSPAVHAGFNRPALLIFY